MRERRMGPDMMPLPVRPWRRSLRLELKLIACGGYHYIVYVLSDCLLVVFTTCIGDQRVANRRRGSKSAL
jgi:hypothetical protein